MNIAFFHSLLLFLLGTGDGQLPKKIPEAVRITVSDVTGAVIPGAVVVMKSAADLVVGEGTTDRLGRVETPLQQGNYHFSVIGFGFEVLRGDVEVKGPGEQLVALTLQGASLGYSGPCCFDPRNLPLIGSGPLTQLITEEPSKPLIGGIIDRGGAPIPKAQILLKSRTGQRTYKTADAEGRYRFMAKPAEYTISAKAQGFRTGSTHVHLVSNGQGSVDIKLDVGGCTECVEVQGMASFMPCVTDEMNTPMVTAEVALSSVHPTNGLEHKAVRLDDWGCGWAQVTPGAYQVSVRASGFRTIREHLAIAQEPITSTFVLKAVH